MCNFKVNKPENVGFYPNKTFQFILPNKSVSPSLFSIKNKKKLGNL